MLCNKQFFLATLILPVLLIAIEAANAEALSADYLSAESVIDFNSYDFGGGVLLIKEGASTFTTGSTITGFFQTYVNSHQLNGVGVSNPTLNNTGSGTGYELTMVADFSAKITNASLPGFFGFELESGEASLYLDKSPDYSFTADFGFDNGEEILSSQDVAGSGFISSFGFGVVNVDFFSSSIINKSVYGDVEIAAASAIFALDANNLEQINGVTTVAGNSVGASDFLFAVDGGLKLSKASNIVATPLPLSVWLFGSAMISLVSFRCRKGGGV